MEVAVANGPGVSVAQLGDGRWRVRWRETLAEGGERRRVQRERVVRDERTAVDLRSRVLRAVESGQVFVDEAREVQRVASVDEVVTGYLAARAARGGAASSAAQRDQGGRRALATLRAVLRLADDALVPADRLDRDAVAAATAELRRQGYGAGTIQHTIGVLLRAWAWAGRDPTRYPGLAPLPAGSDEDMRPEPPVYAAPPAPTLAEVDAMIRHLSGATARAWALVARSTGLRAQQVYELRVEDLDAGGPRTLRITSGKSKRERAARRVMPIPAHLAAQLAQLAEGRAPGDYLLPRVRGVTPRTPDRQLRAAWAAATAAGEAREETWNPGARSNARPAHALRAAYQGHLVAAGVAEVTIDALVGHAGGVRAGHYVDASSRAAAMRAAVETIPAPDLRRAEAGNVVPLPGLTG